MALTAALAVAVAAWCAAAAQGGAAVGSLSVAPALLALALVPGVVASGARRSARVLPEGRATVVLTAVTIGGAGALFLAGWTNGAHVGAVARLLPLAVVALSVLWPQPDVVRYCLLLAVGSLLGAAVAPGHATWAVGATLVAAAVGLVATNRLSAAGAPRLGRPTGTGRRRVAVEAVAVLVVAGLLAALATSLLPPPPGQGSARQQRGRRRPSPGRAGPTIAAGDRLDVGGGRGKPSNAILFRVAADGPDVWRTTTYDRWDGEAWRRSPDGLAQFDERGDSDDGTASAGRTLVPPGIGDAVTADGRFVQRVTIQAASATVLVAAPRPVRVTAPGAEVGVGSDASLVPATPLVRGDSYVVESARSQAGAGALREGRALPVPADVAARYLQLPVVSPGVRALALQLTAGQATAYDTVQALDGWLGANTTVTDTAAAVPSGTDTLDAFLLGDRAGPPERVATSMAVMLRTLGIPARLAVGFLPGTREGLAGDFVVRGTDAHAWVEVWFPIVGWQRFDPTGKAPPPGARDDSLWARLKRLARRLWPMLVLVVVAAAAWLAWWGGRWWRRRAAQPWAARYFARLERAGRTRGRPRQPQETPAEYAAGLAGSVLPDPRLVEVGALVTAAAFSGRQPPAEDRARAEEVLRQAVRAHPGPRLPRRAHRAPPAAAPTLPPP